MKVSYHPVTERGVSQLMYVGDDGLPSSSSIDLPVGLTLGFGIAKTRGIVRLGLIGYALFALWGAKTGRSILPGG